MGSQTRETGDFLVFDAATGRELYRFNTGGAMGGGVISYAVKGRQYIAAASGRAGFFGSTGAATLFVFAFPLAAGNQGGRYDRHREGRAGLLSR